MKTPIVLASASPRRQELLQQAGIEFEVIVKNIEEDFPESIKCDNVAEYLAKKKADAYEEEVTKGKIIITADTVVCLNNKLLGKPNDYQEAFDMLKLLSGNTHKVITAVCLRFKDKNDCFYETTEVTFKSLTDSEIDYYIKNYNPYDKAGGYGIQEWIGLLAVTKINGSYYNVVGLPVAEVIEHLRLISK